MLTKTQEQILAFLLGNPEQNFTIRGIAKKLNKSYTLVYNNLSDLEKENIIRKEAVPPAQIVLLNEFASTDIFVDIELKRKKTFLQKHSWVKLMLEDILDSAACFFILLVFGSYAKEKSTSKSDLDLLIITQDKKDIKEVENAIQRAYTKVKKSPIFVDVNDFKEMVRNPRELNVGNEAKRNHIILYGAEEYYQLLKKAYKK